MTWTWLTWGTPSIPQPRVESSFFDGWKDGVNEALDFFWGFSILGQSHSSHGWTKMGVFPWRTGSKMSNVWLSWNIPLKWLVYFGFISHFSRKKRNLGFSHRGEPSRMQRPPVGRCLEPTSRWFSWPLPSLAIAPDRHERTGVLGELEKHGTCEACVVWLLSCLMK